MGLSSQLPLCLSPSFIVFELPLICWFTFSAVGIEFISQKVIKIGLSSEPSSSSTFHVNLSARNECDKLTDESLLDDLLVLVVEPPLNAIIPVDAMQSSMFSLSD